MNSCDAYIEKLSSTLPDVCTTEDLIDIGIFRSEQTASIARRKGYSPPYFKMKHGAIVYPKESVIQYLRECKKYNEICHTRRPYSSSKTPKFLTEWQDYEL